MLGFWPLGFLPLGFFQIDAGVSLTADVTATEANDTAAGNAVIVTPLSASVAVVEQDDAMSALADIEDVQPQFVGGAAWNWPKSRRDRRYIDEAPEPLPAVETPRPPRAKLALPQTPAFDVAGALAKAREAARGVAADEVFLRRAERREAALQRAQAVAVAQAAARAKADADDEDDIEALLMAAW